MDELFFGYRRPKTKRAPVKRTKSSPKRKRSPTRMCRKGLSLPKLRKLAMEHGVNIYSEAKTAISKRTGLPKKPKMVSCATLKSRLRKAGLEHLYKKSMPSVDVKMPEMPEMHEELFDEMEPVPMTPMVSDKEMEDYYKMDYGKHYRAGARPKKSQKHAGVIVVKGRTHQVFRGKEGGLYYMKGKSGAKIYIDKKRLKKSSKAKSPKRR
jgi:hypothetical protein